MDDQRADPVVLLVDDDEMERFLHRQALEPAGFEIVEAEDGAAALEAFAITMPDIVLLDVLMPRMDGFAVCEAIRAMPAGRNTPILMATGLDDVQSIERAYQVGATDFIPKPISRPVLAHRLRYMLRAYHLAEAHRIAGLGTFRWLPKSTRIDCSPEVSQMFGLAGNTSTQPARHLLRRVPPADRASLIHAIRNALDGTKAELDHQIITVEGEVRTLSLRVEVAGALGAPKYLSGSYQDITERKRIESELRAARDEAHRVNAAKAAFLCSVSHEFRTPLNAVIGFSDLIVREAFGPIPQRKYVEFANDIRSAGQRALGVFLDVQTMTELEADQFQLQLESVDVREVVETAVADFRRTEMGADREIVFEAKTDNSVITADLRAIREMLVKLLSNAAKFSAPGTTIRVTLASNGGGFLQLSVADGGIGMTAADLELAVRPFGKLDDGITRRYQGLGLGLSIVSRLIERHGGQLTIASTPRQGTHISLHFPAKPPAGRRRPQYERGVAGQKNRPIRAFPGYGHGRALTR